MFSGGCWEGGWLKLIWAIVVNMACQDGHGQDFWHLGLIVGLCNIAACMDADISDLNSLHL